MHKYKVEFLTPALLDIDKIADYHLQMVGPKSAEKITNKLLDATELLQQFPLSGMEHPDNFLHERGYRKLICGDYVCVYRLISDIVYIYRVVHSASDYPKLFR